MTRLELTQEKKAALLDRALLVGLPVFLTWYSLGHTARYYGAAALGGQVVADPTTLLYARLTAIAIGVGVGAPLAYAAVRIADGWGLDEDSREAGDSSGDASTSR